LFWKSINTRKAENYQLIYDSKSEKFDFSNYRILDNKYVIIKDTLYKNSRGRGKRKQPYFLLKDGRIKHPNQLKNLDKQDIRDLIIQKILENE
jgi:hypothetical protein